MKVRRFTGASTREALRAVKQALGAEAVILSSSESDGRVEITAVPAEALQAIEAARSSSAAPASSAPGAAPASATTARWADGILEEIGSLRELIERQAWGELRAREPTQAALLRELLQAGFSPGLAQHVSANLPAQADLGRALHWARAVLARNFACAAEDEMIATGGVYALMGPTGVGKTTTVAKIAARCVVRYGAARLALLTTDSFRVGAHEQLRIYGRILGVAVHAVGDAADLRGLLEDLRDRHIVLIDTVGMGQRDNLVADQIAMLAAAGRPVSRLLLMGACSSADALDESVRAYGGEARAGGGLHGAILTKLDEAVGLGAALDVVVRHRLKLHYVTNGQRVPEDLHAPNSDYLLHRALAARPPQPAFRLRDADVPSLLMTPRRRPAAHAGV